MSWTIDFVTLPTTGSQPSYTQLRNPHLYCFPTLSRAPYFRPTLQLVNTRQHPRRRWKGFFFIACVPVCIFSAANANSCCWFCPSIWLLLLVLLIYVGPFGRQSARRSGTFGPLSVLRQRSAWLSYPFFVIHRGLLSYYHFPFKFLAL